MRGTHSCTERFNACSRPHPSCQLHPDFLRKFDYTTGQQEGAEPVPHQDRPARIPWSVGVRVR
eukprot:5176257-Prymnesium_polylepis.2